MSFKSAINLVLVFFYEAAIVLQRYEIVPGSKYTLRTKKNSAMNLFTPSKGGNRGTELAVAPSSLSQEHTELAELVKKHATELEGQQCRLEQAELASPKRPESTLETIAEF